MSIELKVPEVGESVHEVQIGRWLKSEGDAVPLDEKLVELETDKASMELPAPAAGILRQILKRQGDMVVVGDIIGYLENGDAATAKKPESAESPKSQPSAQSPAPTIKPRPVVAENGDHDSDVVVTPAARRALREHGIKASEVHSDGESIRRDDVLRHVESLASQSEQPQARAAKPLPPIALGEPASAGVASAPASDLEEIVPMSLIRKRIAARLVQAQQQAALLTTFNEIDMTAVKELRDLYRDSFQKKYGVKLGFMPFFVKATIDALKQEPALNAEIRGEKIIYRRYFNIGMAVSSTKGLVVPVLHHTERLSFAEIEQAINNFSLRASENKLEPKDFEGGTFTISNGGVFGSLMSTPIVNPPQSGVLGLHAIQDRPIALKGQVVIRPMMYVALTYDHRLVDGREAVTFLRRIKETIEDPSRMLLEV